MTRKELVKILKVVSDQTRLDILASIYSHPEISGKELLVTHHVSQPTLSFHLSKLEQIKMIIVKKVGQTHYYKVNWKLITDFEEQLRGWVQSKRKN